MTVAQTTGYLTILSRKGANVSQGSVTWWDF